MTDLLKLAKQQDRERLRDAIETALATGCTNAAAVQHLFHPRISAEFRVKPSISDRCIAHPGNAYHAVGFGDSVDLWTPYAFDQSQTNRGSHFMDGIGRVRERGDNRNGLRITAGRIRAACYIPARRATASDPMRALRAE